MDWAKIIAQRARKSGVLHTGVLARDLGVSESSVQKALRRQEDRELVEHVGRKIFINRLAADFSGRELINLLRPEAYLSLETVLRDAGISTQTPRSLTCVTPARPGVFRAKSIAVIFRHITRKLYWGFHEQRTRYGKYNLGEPEKALLDWIYLRRQEGLPAPTDELEVTRLDWAKLIEYSEAYPRPVKQQVLELVVESNLAQHQGRPR
jgi:hypothetical protein